MFDIVFFGKPGSGKWTQAELLRDALKGQISHLSTGDIFRSLTSRPNAIGDYVTDRMNAGFLIDDAVTISLFNAYFYTVIDSDKAMLLDGYPRTMQQMEAFLNLCTEKGRTVIWLNFELDDETTIERMMSRARDGEDAEVMKTRLEQYYHHTHPLVERFAQAFPLYNIDASLSIESIHEEVKRLVS